MKILILGAEGLAAITAACCCGAVLMSLSDFVQGEPLSLLPLASL